MLNYETRYRFKGSNITYEELITKVFEYLGDNPFQTHEFIANKVGSRPSIIEGAIKDGVIRITKKYKEENGVDITFPYLCRTYGVKMSYIEDLIEEGRIIIKDNGESLNEIRELENDAMRKQKIDNLRKLSESFKTSSETPRESNNQGCFHHYKSDRRR